MKNLKVFLWVCLSFFNPFAVYAGSLTPPAPPDDPAAAVYTLEDLWYRLSDGMIGEKRTGEFSEPVSGPGDYGHSIDDLMSIAPAPVSESAASPEDVPEGMTFWCLNPDDGKWGTQTGTMTVHDLLNITPGAAEQSIPAGYYSEAGTVAGDANLVSGNIRSGTDIFGVTGNVIQSAGDAAAGDVLTGKTFSNAASAGAAGTMPNNGAVNITPGTAAQAIAAGYHNGLGTVAGDTDLAAENIKSGTDIFGVTGNVIQSAGDAAAGDVLTGKTFSNATAANVSGTMANAGQQTLTPGTSNTAITQGYHDGTGYCEGDVNLISGNIAGGKTIFGVAGAVYAPVAKTGQTPTLPVTAPAGSDGALQKGVADPIPRFTNNSDGTITDNRTGLIWLKNANCFGEKNWTSALTDVAGLADGACGLTDGSAAGDWRLPNMRELHSLIDLSRSVPALPTGHPFSNLKNDYYWSATTHAFYTTSAWTVGLSYGNTSDSTKMDTEYVWAVRGGS
jgi:hypothetical protein